MKLYRAIPESDFKADKVYTRYPQSRLPGNVPYVVDNLWEFFRDDDKPSRRFAVYASPTAELAMSNASAYTTGKYIPCELEFKNSPKAMQLSVTDARYHADIKKIQNKLHSYLYNFSFEEKENIALLFMPGMTKVELSDKMKNNLTLSNLVEKLKDDVTIWQDVANVNGEMFFELDSNNSYQLKIIA